MVEGRFQDKWLEDRTLETSVVGRTQGTVGESSVQYTGIEGRTLWTSVIGKTP